MLSLWFQVSGGAIVEAAQVVSVCEPLNDVTSGVIAEITPRVAVAVQVSGDQYLPIQASNEARQVLGCKVIRAWCICYCGRLHGHLCSVL